MIRIVSKNGETRIYNDDKEIDMVTKVEIEDIDPTTVLPTVKISAFAKIDIEGDHVDELPSSRRTREIEL